MDAIMQSSSNQTVTLAEVRYRVKLLTKSLPTIIDAGSFRTTSGKICCSKAPTIALSFRETQAWRVEEFARSGCDLIERGDLVAGIANIRHMMECCAAIWYLLEIIENPVSTNTDHKALYEKLGRLFVGSKNIFPDMPRAINVLNFIEKLDRKFPGAAKRYDRLSEISHPNWAGSAAMYSKRTDDNFTTHFGREVKDNSSTRTLALGSLLIGLEIFAYAYNRITGCVPSFVDACEASLKPE